jgi:hypothetical protein
LLTGSAMPRVQGGIPRIAVQGVPVQVEVVLESLPEFDHRPTGGNPEFAAKSDEVVFAVGTENPRVWGSVRLRHQESE